MLLKCKPTEKSKNLVGGKDIPNKLRKVGVNPILLKVIKERKPQCVQHRIKVRNCSFWSNKNREVEERSKHIQYLHQFIYDIL